MCMMYFMQLMSVFSIVANFYEEQSGTVRGPAPL